MGSGVCSIETAQVDSICEHVADIKKSYNDAKQGKKDAELEEAKNTWVCNIFVYVYVYVVCNTILGSRTYFSIQTLF